MAFEDLESGAGEQRGRQWLSWTMPALLGLLVYELTTQPALGAAMLCLKFGWNDFLNALWLRRTDPNRGRGQACFWLYLSAALWKVTAPSIIVFVSVGLLSAWAHGFQNGKQIDQALGEIMPIGLILGSVGAVLAVSSCLLAVGLSARLELRLWYNTGTVRWARRNGSWPPRDGRLNFTEVIFAVTALALAAPLLPLSCCGAGNVMKVLPLPGPLQVLVGACLWFSLLYIAVRIGRRVETRSRSRIAARPEDCWGTDSLPEPNVYDSYISDAGPAD